MIVFEPTCRCYNYIMNHCLQCNFKTKNPRFCSRSCAATFNNLSGRVRRRKPEGSCRGCKAAISTRKTWCDDCINIFLGSPPRKSRTFSTGLEGPCPESADRGVDCSCGKSISKGSRYCKSCSAKASSIAKSNKRIIEWLEGSWRGGTDYGLSQIVRKYLLEQNNYCCSKCGFNKNHPDDEKTILEINHINGDGTDHSPQNLEVLCPNCHALTSSYRARNMGSGRPVYYLRKTI